MANEKSVPSYFYHQSAAVPYRRGKNGLEILLVTSIRKKRWIVPKGVVEPDLTPWESAEKEAWEEAGVGGRISDESLGSYETEKWGGVCRVEVFPLKVKNEAKVWPESSVRQRRWLPLDEALEKIEQKALRRVVARLGKAV